MKSAKEQIDEMTNNSVKSAEEKLAAISRMVTDFNNALNKVKQTLFYSLPCGHIVEDDCECRQRGNA